jgi:DNA-binding beta-propeller fold protein YncE
VDADNADEWVCYPTAKRKFFTITLTPRKNQTMKTIIPSDSRPLLRAYYAFLIAIAALWAMPRTAHAQLYVINTPGGGGQVVVSKYNATTGAAINASFITGLINLTFAPDFGLAVSGNTLFVGDVLGFVGKYDATTGGAINASFITGLNRPAGLALLGNTLFVANSGSDTVGEYDAKTGAAINASFITGLNGPTGLAVSGNKLFVAGFFNGTVGEYDAKTGAAINDSFITGLHAPLGLALLGNTLFVANSNFISGTVNSGAVGEYDATTGAAINASFITGLTVPSGLAVKSAK